MKVNSIVTKSNNFNYARVIVDNNIVLSTRSDIKFFEYFNNHHQKHEFTKVLSLYNSGVIKYSTVLYVKRKFSKLYNNKQETSFLNILTEFSWESGLVSNKGLTFTNPNAKSTCGCGETFSNF